MASPYASYVLFVRQPHFSDAALMIMPPMETAWLSGGAFAGVHKVHGFTFNF